MVCGAKWSTSCMFENVSTGILDVSLRRNHGGYPGSILFPAQRGKGAGSETRTNTREHVRQNRAAKHSYFLEHCRTRHTTMARHARSDERKSSLPSFDCSSCFAKSSGNVPSQEHGHRSLRMRNENFKTNHKPSATVNGPASAESPSERVLLNARIAQRVEVAVDDVLFRSWPRGQASRSHSPSGEKRGSKDVETRKIHVMLRRELVAPGFLVGAPLRLVKLCGSMSSRHRVAVFSIARICSFVHLA